MSENTPRPRGIPFMERFSELVSVRMGSSWAFMIALGIVIGWGASGPAFGYSDTWQLVINTGTTVVTFLMVFLIQRSQNKAMEAVVLKLNELVASIEGASNRLIDVEDLSEKELHQIHGHYRRLAEMSKQEVDVASSHSIDEAEDRHHRKNASREKQKAPQ